MESLVELLDSSMSIKDFDFSTDGPIVILFTS